MTKIFAVLTTGFFLLLSPAIGQSAENPGVSEHFLGKADAPIKVQEFASLTCSHCADFYNEIMPELEKRYVETGKVRFILRDFPLDGVGLKAAALAHCMPADQYYPFVRVLYKNLTAWAMSPNPDQTLVQYAKLGGLGEDKAKACLQDTKMLDAIVAVRSAAVQKYDVKATPTFIINDGEQKIEGARSLEDFTTVFDKLLAAKP